MVCREKAVCSEKVPVYTYRLQFKIPEVETWKKANKKYAKKRGNIFQFPLLTVLIYLNTLRNLPFQIHKKDNSNIINII